MSQEAPQKQSKEMLSLENKYLLRTITFLLSAIITFGGMWANSMMQKLEDIEQAVKTDHEDIIRIKERINLTDNCGTDLNDEQQKLAQVFRLYALKPDEVTVPKKERL